MKRTIDRVDVNGSNREVLVNHTLGAIRGIAVDWVGNKLYWTDKYVSSTNVYSGVEYITSIWLL